MFDEEKIYQCPIGYNPETCTCSSCVMNREWVSSLESMKRADAKNFASGSSFASMSNQTQVDVPKKSLKERLQAQRKANLEESDKAFANLQSQKTSINPNNMYWPPYNPLAPEGEKTIELEYTQDVVNFAVLAPIEWTSFFDTFDIVKNLKDAGTGLYNAKTTAAALGGVGVTALVKTIDGVDYVILKNYKYWEQTLLHGGVFKADNARVVRLGLGALDSVKGMTRYVKVTAPMDILVGSAINVLQFIVNDEYTLRKLSVDEAKLFINTLVVAGVSLAAGTLVSLSAPITFTTGAIILVVSNLVVWGVDKWTNFESKLVNKVIEEFDDE